MSKLTIQRIGIEIKNKRGTKGLRETAKIIGVSAATLSRIESGKQPDLDTFVKICKWLEINPSEILSFEETQPFSSDDVNNNSFTSAHLRANRELSPETASHLTQAILSMREFLSMNDDVS